jgi:cobalt-zinc-cadmium efflux system outer membrane protein
VFLSVPLPVFNRNQGEIERARQEQRQIQWRIQGLEAAIAGEVENAYQQFQTARSLLDAIAGQMVGQARDVRGITEFSYTRGEATLLQLLDAERAFNETMQAYNEARAEYARNLYLLEAVSGKEVGR